MYSLEVKDNKLIITNKSYNLLHLDVLNTTQNFSSTVWDLRVNQSRPLGLNHDTLNDRWAWDRIHITDKETFFDIFHVKDNVLYRKVSPPNSEVDINIPFTLVTGHSGGGTSIVIKSLRHLGAHAGEDCGQFSNRKAHESSSFRTWLYHFVGKNAPKKYIKSTLPIILDSYEYQPDKVNLVKLTDLVDNGLYNKFIDIFPNTKILSIVKPKSKNTQSREGKRFNESNEFEIYRQQHPSIEGTPIFHLNWKKYFTDFHYVNKVLQYLDMDLVLTQVTFDEMLKAINFDNSKLLTQ